MNKAAVRQAYLPLTPPGAAQVNNAGIARVGDVTFAAIPPASMQTASMMREAYETNVFGVLEVRADGHLPLALPENTSHAGIRFCLRNSKFCC